MKKSRFRDQQITFVPRQAEEGMPVAEVCRKAGIISQPGLGDGFVHNQLFDDGNIRILTVVTPSPGCRRRSRCASNFVAPMSPMSSNG